VLIPRCQLHLRHTNRNGSLHTLPSDVIDKESGGRHNLSKKIFSRERPRHQGCQYPDGKNVLLVNKLTGEIGEVAELAYQEFRATVLNQPRPAKTGTQKRRTSEPRSNRPLKKARTMSVASMPVISPVARVQPPPPPRFSQAPVRSSVKNDNVDRNGSLHTLPSDVIDKESGGRHNLSTTNQTCGSGWR
jgi:hypothetical protein